MKLKATLLATLAAITLFPTAAVSEETADQAQDEEWGDDWGDDWDESEESTGPSIPITGFVETTAGYRTQEAKVLRQEWVSQEIRARIQSFYQKGRFNLSYKGEAFYDGILDEWHARNREAYVGFSPTSKMDVRLGRQPLTWGTGDLLFLNDFFPKDWVAFFSGYDMQYLKAPSDALKVSTYSQLVNIDFVWTPQFDSDNFITGEKLVYYSPLANRVVAAPPELLAEDPGSSLSDGEFALRANKKIDSVEYALYLYRGYFKIPEGFNPLTFQPYFPLLNSVGGSVRGTFLGGIANMEYAYWDSKESDSGSNLLVPNSQSRFLIGYETEVVRNLTASVQYYVEHLHDYKKRKVAFSDPDLRPRKNRQVLTTRWTLVTDQGNLNYSLFAFYSPSDQDYYLIPSVYYRLSDKWQFNAGANILGGDKNHTLFGQMETNSNVYLRAKYLF